MSATPEPPSAPRRRLHFDCLPRSRVTPGVSRMMASTTNQQPTPQSRRSSSGGHMESVPVAPVIIQQMQDNHVTSTETDTKQDSGMSDPSIIGKEKTPMCLVNELARYNKIEHQYRLTSEDGPPHKKKFTVTLKLGGEEYTSDGPSIKKAQHSAASLALKSTQYKHPPPKVSRILRQGKGNITPTVELNALAMKRGEPTIYTFIEMPQFNQFDRWGMYSQKCPSDPDPVASQNNGFSHKWRPGQVNPQSMRYQRYYGGAPAKGLFKVTVKVGEREFSGEGISAQAARHDAAAKALHTLRSLPLDTNSTIHHTGTCDGTMIDVDSSSELKSPISLVHEIALKRNLPVIFEVVSEKGPPHMRTFVTRCVVGDKFETTGEGNGKKISKKRAAEQMLDKLRTLPPTTTVTAAGCANTLARMKRKTNTAKKKSRNLIKDTVIVTTPSMDEKSEFESIEEINPISMLIQMQQSKKEREPVYTLREERGLARRREFLIEVTVGEHSFVGSGPNKKMAKRNAAEGLLQMLGYISPRLPTTGHNVQHNKVRFSDEKIAANGAGGGVNSGGSSGSGSGSTGGSAGVHGRQLAPGLLLVPGDTKATNGQIPPQSQHKHPGVNLKASAAIAQEYLADGSSPTADALGHNRGAAPPKGAIRPKEQLSYLAKLSNFHIQFSDFPKGNHSEFLSLVTLDTDPPHVCHGAGATVDISQDQAALNALRSLSKMGLDSITTPPKKEQQISPGPSPEGLYMGLSNSIAKDDSYINGK